MFNFSEGNQEVPVRVEDIMAAAQRIAANCRAERSEATPCPTNCPGLTACGLAGWEPARQAQTH